MTGAMLPDGADTAFYGTGLSWYELFHTPPRRGNAYIQMAHQYMAAYLNVLNGADNTVVADDMAQAEEWFVSRLGCFEDPRSCPADERAEMSALAGRLASYNEGTIGPGHCDTTEVVPGYSMTPENVALTAVYPNPFETSTQARVALPEGADVTVAVYDVLGREVARLMDGFVEAGEHTVTWDAQDAPNGTYVIVLQTGTVRETRNVVLVR